MSHQRSTRIGRARLWLPLILAVAAVIVTWALWPRGNDPIGGGGTGQVDPMLVLTRAALAASENLNVDEADTSWTSLQTEFPNDESVALNLSLTRVLRVDDLSAQALNTSLTKEEKLEARRQLPDAISSARAAIDAYAALTSDAVMPVWLRARVDLHEASLLPMTKSLRRQIYTRLSDAITGPIGQEPTSIILGGTLISILDLMEDPVDGLPNDVLESASQTVSELSDRIPDNIFIAMRAAQLNVSHQDPVATKYIRRVQELSAAIKPSVRRETMKPPIRLAPDELAQQIDAAIEENRWQDVNRAMLPWFNVLTSTEIVKTDLRRATPHPLDRLSFESLRQLSADAAGQDALDVSQAALAFTKTPIETADFVAIQMIDFDLDLDDDLVGIDSSNTVTLWENAITDGETSWRERATLSLTQPATALLVADLFVVDSSDPERFRIQPGETLDGDDSSKDYAASNRHNTVQNLVAYGSEGVQVIRVDGREDSEQPVLTVVESATGLEDVRGVKTAIAGDLEADGDIDLVFATESDGVRMFANRGNRTFFEILPGATGFSRDDPVVAFAMGDLDRDLDLDLVSLHDSGRVALIENLLHLQFRGRYLADIDAIDGGNAIAIEDIDGNVSWDLLITGSKGSRLVYSQTADASAWTIERVESSTQPTQNALVADLNNDSWTDLVSLSETIQWSSLGPWGWEDEWRNADNLVSGQQAISVDHNRDGRLDVISLTSGQINVFTNQTDSGHYLDVRFRGVDDNVSGRVNHYAIGSVLELRFGPHYRAKIVTSPVTHFGIDGFDQAGTLRAILPNGLTQTVRDPGVDLMVEEEQTNKGSCPYLYAWDGEKFIFKTDCLWAAPLGLQVASGVVAKDRPWEYLKIDGSDIQPRGDGYEFRITEELWEIAYFDEVALTVVDHPANVDVWTNEKVGPANIAEPTIFAFEHGRLFAPDVATDTVGNNVQAKLAFNDQDFVQGFDRRIMQGLCPPHWIDLDFSSAIRAKKANSAKAYLVLTGWILPTDTSLNIQIDQNPSLGPIEFPSIWVPDPDATTGWRKAIPYMGFPGGKTKTIVVDVSEALVEGDPRLRIRTSAQIYWDSAKLAVQPEPAEFRAHDVALKSAEVTSHGYSRRIRNDLTHPEWYDYQDASTEPRWPPLRGLLTRFGECTDLLKAWDDQMVVISGGDEIRLVFEMPDAELPEGWVRDFVLHSVGWDKDADLNTLEGQSSLPLPYREMTEYPPPPEDRDRAAKMLQLNRDHLQRTQSFRAYWPR